jgi:hypothetical protein
MEKYDALLALCLLKQPIAKSFKVLNNPAKILQWTLLLFSRTQRVIFLSMPIYTPSQCPLGRVIQNSQPIFCLSSCSMPTYQSFIELLRYSVCNCVSPHPCLLRCSTNSKFFLRVNDFSFCAHLARLCLNPQSSEVHLCTGIQRPQYSVMPSWHETTKNLSRLKIKQLPANV